MGKAMGGGTIEGGRPNISASSPGIGDACVQAFWGTAASGGRRDLSRRDLRYSILATGLTDEIKA